MGLHEGSLRLFKARGPLMWLLRNDSPFLEVLIMGVLGA